MQYLIGYDICDAKRLQKIHKKLCSYAIPIQYSVFLFDGKNQELQRCIQDLLKIFNPKEDDLRIYPLPSNAKQWQLGKPILPEGIIWTALPLNTRIASHEEKNNQLLYTI